MSGGDAGWERCQTLRTTSASRVLGLEGSADDDSDSDEEDYEEPEEGESSKKRRPKAPRGASKKQKTEAAVASKKASQNLKKKTAAAKPGAKSVAKAGKARKRAESRIIASIVGILVRNRFGGIYVVKRAQNAPAAEKNAFFLKMSLRDRVNQGPGTRFRRVNQCLFWEKNGGSSKVVTGGLFWPHDQL
ncbi:hypothetical protein B0H14DRAFT_2645239 [Mycena olivaceomarginata]|nr:hypothetical protein B0H14DRAFT_2645239 [Mycena olivaceomarginata]